MKYLCWKRKIFPVYSDLKLPLANQLPTKHFYLNFRKRKTETETKLKKQRKKLLSHHLRPGRVCLLKMSCLPMTTLRWKTWKHLDKVYFINEIIYRYHTVSSQNFRSLSFSGINVIKRSIIKTMKFFSLNRNIHL